MKSSYTSSEITHRSLSVARSTSAWKFSRVSTEPVGLDGEFTTRPLVLGVIRAFMASMSGWKPSSSRSGYGTGFASTSMLSGSYRTKPGSGIRTSSPGSKSDWNVAIVPWVPEAVMMTFSLSISFLYFWTFPAIRSRSSSIPFVGP